MSFTLHAFNCWADRRFVATPPRYIVPGQTLYLTIEAARRQFRFVPRNDLVESIRFIFWYCAKKYGMAVHEALWMSNHAHICLTDVQGILPNFMCQMNSLISRQINALLDDTGTNIQKGYSSIEIADDASMLRLSSYTLANPCAADLVSKASEWEGFSTYKHDYNQPFIVERPKCGIWREDNSPHSERTRTGDSITPNTPPPSRWRRKPSKLPELVEGVLDRPKIMPELSDKELRRLVRHETGMKEDLAKDKRREAKKDVLGCKAILAQDSNARPRKRRELFKRQPLVASHNEELKQFRVNRIHAFRQRYREALDRFLEWGAGQALFPKGTWKMRVLYKIPCSPRMA